MEVTKIEVVKFYDDFLEVVRVAANGAVGNVNGKYWVAVKGDILYKITLVSIFS